MFLIFHISHTQLNLQRETSNMIAISLRDTTGVKHAEDYIKLSVADSQLIYPTKVSAIRGVCVCVWHKQHVCTRAKLAWGNL